MLAQFRNMTLLLVPISAFIALFLTMAIPISVKPLLWLCVLGFWLIYRPDLLSWVMILVFALTHDLLLGAQFGHGVVGIMMLALCLRLTAPYLAERRFLVIWMAFMIAQAGYFAIQWGLAWMIEGEILAVMPSLLVLVLGGLCWPLCYLLLNPLARKLAIIRPPQWHKPYRANEHG